MKTNDNEVVQTGVKDIGKGLAQATYSNGGTITYEISTGKGVASTGSTANAPAPSTSSGSAGSSGSGPGPGPGPTPVVTPVVSGRAGYMILPDDITLSNGTKIPAGSQVAKGTDGKPDFTKPYFLPTGEQRNGIGGTTTPAGAGTTPSTSPATTPVVSPTSSQYGSSLTPGTATPFGAIQGQGDVGLPLGLGLAWHELLLKNLQNMASTSGFQYTYDPATGTYKQGAKTPAQEWQDLQTSIAKTNSQLQEAAVSGTFNGQPTLAAQQLKQQADQFSVTSGLSRDQLNAQIMQFASTNDLATKQLALQQGAQQFTQAQTMANLAANPRTSIEASFLGQTRGGLGPDASNPSAGLMAFQKALGGTSSPSTVRAAVMPQGYQDPNQPAILQGPGQGQPGSMAHYATENRQDGSQVHYFGTPTQQADGSIANVPVGAFTRALMEGKGVASAGNLGVTGGYTTSNNLRTNLDPNRVKLADYLRASPSEQSQFAGAASYAGYSPEDLNSTLNRFMPQDRSVSGGARY